MAANPRQAAAWNAAPLTKFRTPLLPLPRWRAHGELGEFIPWDLQFTEAEAVELTAVRLGRTPETAAVRDIWRRMRGWAAGLTMALQSHRPGPSSGPVGSGGLAPPRRRPHDDPPRGSHHRRHGARSDHCVGPAARAGVRRLELARGTCETRAMRYNNNPIRGANKAAKQRT